jgi:PAS domain S-box-containing protein
LLRYDPSVALPAPPPLRSLITHVTLAVSNRTIFVVGGKLEPLTYSDNSLTVHFMATRHSLTTPVTFGVKLEGTGEDWLQVGSTGSAFFNRLKEGRFVMHVRPVSAGQAGAESTLDFSVLPPWYRTTSAYLAFGLLGLCVAFAALLLPSTLHRRQRTRLEALVQQRTRELNESNARLARQLQEIKALSQAIEQSPVGVRIERLDGTIEFANPRQERTTGYAPEELVGMNFAALLADQGAAEVRREISATIERGESWHGQLTNRLKTGGTCRVRTTISPIRRPEGDAYLRLVLEEDITEWLEAQQRRRDLEEQLFQSQKLESLGTLAGGIAHDFNNILTAILGTCELARSSLDAASPVTGDLQSIYNAGLRARDLVKRILTFTRRGTTKLIALDLAAPVAEAVSLIKASTPSTIEIVEQRESGTVLADATHIQQVVLNLCTNAIHAMEGRPGRLTVSTRRLEVEDSLASGTSGLVPGPYMRLVVADTGCGMDATTLKRIFDPFFTTKKPGEGTGLGLAIVQSFMSELHGVIRVQSTPGVGTSFELYFPRSEDAPAPATNPTAPLRGNLQEILVVDDEPMIVDFLGKRLRLAGYAPHVFTDSQDAFAAFELLPGRYKAVIADLTMPHQTGIDLAQRIRAVGSMIPVVIITGYSSTDTAADIEKIPHCALIEKPIDGDELVNLLGKLFGQTG